MEAKDKAKELVEKFQSGYQLNGFNYQFQNDDEEAKQCALICVDEILNTLNTNIRDLDVRGNILLDLIDYWQQVRKEIEKLNN